MAQQLRLKSQRYSAKDVFSYAIEVLVDTGVTHLNKPFTYAVSEKMPKLQFGSLVSVPFGNKILPGLVIQTNSKPVENIKFIKKVIHINPIITRNQFYIFEEAAKRWTGGVWNYLKFAVPSIPAKYEVPSIVDSGISRKVEGPELRIGAHFEDLLELIEARVNPSRQLLIIVPDQKIKDFLKRGVSKKFTEYTSQLDQQERIKNYLLILSGEANLIIGNRSAIFLPLKSDAEILIVDDLSFAYYESRYPYWNVRDIGLIRSKSNSITFYTHSPSLELVRLAELGWMKVRQKKTERKNYYFKNERISYQTVVKNALKQGPVLILTPERGYVNALVCSRCRNLYICTVCSGRLIQSSRNAKPECQLCGVATNLTKCSYCEGNQILSFGKGIDKTFEELGSQFPNVEIRKVSEENITLKRNLIVIANYGKFPLIPYSAVIHLGFEKFAYQNHLRSSEIARKQLFDTLALKCPDFYYDFEAQNYFAQVLQLGNSYKSAQRELADRNSAKLPPEYRLVTIECDTKGAEIFETLNFVESVTFISGKCLIRVSLNNASKLSEFLQEVLSYRSLRKLKPWNVKVDPLDI